MQNLGYDATVSCSPRSSSIEGDGKASFGLFHPVDEAQEPDVDPRPRRSRFAPIIAQAVAAEQLNFDRFLIAENHASIANGSCPSPVPLLSAAAALTERIELGPAVALLALHHPVSLAADYAVLDDLSGGRLFMAVGAGISHDSFQAFGIPFEERESRFREALPVFSRLLDGESVSGSGFHLDIPLVTPNARALGPKKIWIACGGISRLRTLIGLGYGVLLSPFIACADVTSVGKALDEVRSAGLNVASNVQLVLHAHFDPDPKIAWDTGFRAMRARIARIAERNLRGGMPDRAAQAHLRRARANNVMLFSDSAGILEGLRSWLDLGLRNFILMMSFGTLTHDDTLRSMEAFSEHVMPHVDALCYPQASA